MITTPTVFEKLPKQQEAPIYGRIRAAVRKLREDLYQDRNQPLLQVKSESEHVGTVLKIKESNDALSIRVLTSESAMNIRLGSGAVYVGDLDTPSRSDTKDLLTDDAVKRHRPLGRWDR